MRHPSQNGNVLFIILIGIVLFAGLMYAFTESSQNSFSNLDREQAQIVATDILNYSQKVEGGVQRLLAKGGSELDISFENSISTTDYTNVNSTPGEYDCHVFHPEGAGLTYVAPPANSGTGTEWVFSSGNGVTGIGNITYSCVDPECLDYLIILKDVNEQVCKVINYLGKVNENTNGDIPLDQNDYSDDAYTGTTPLNKRVIIDGDEKLAYKNTGCFESETRGGYHFYHVLIAR